MYKLLISYRYFRKNKSLIVFQIQIVKEVTSSYDTLCYCPLGFKFAAIYDTF